MTNCFVLLLFVLLFLSSETVAQGNTKGNRYYIAGNFNRINAFNRQGNACWDPKTNTWLRTPVALKATISSKPTTVFINENEAFYAEQNQVWYFNGTAIFPYLFLIML